MPDASFLSSDLFLLTLTVGLYCLGGMIYRRTRLPLLHPVLLTFVAVIVFLRCAGIGYERYRDATGILNFALGMSVVALGYLLYEQLERLRGSLLPVGMATLAGCVVGVLSVVYIAMAFGAERQILNSIAPKSVTVPIAVSVAGPLGGNVGRGLLRGDFRQHLRRMDSAPLRGPRPRGPGIRPRSRSPRHRHGPRHRNRSRRRGFERSGHGPDGAGDGAAHAADGEISVLDARPCAHAAKKRGAETSGSPCSADRGINAQFLILNF